MGARYHFGYNAGDDDVVVLDWFAPPERAPDVPETATMGAKRMLEGVQGGRYELLGAWPDRLPDERRKTLADGGMTKVGPEDALQIVQGVAAADARLDPVVEQRPDGGAPSRSARRRRASPRRIPATRSSSASRARCTSI